MRLLIVDDVQSYQDSLRHALQGEFEVLCATTKGDAVRLLRANPPDSVLIDIRLSEAEPSDRQGLEVLRIVREVCPRVPVVMMSGYVDFDSVVDCFHHGAAWFFKKPILIDDLKDILRQLHTGSGG